MVRTMLQSTQPDVLTQKFMEHKIRCLDSPTLQLLNIYSGKNIAEFSTQLCLEKNTQV